MKYLIDKLPKNIKIHENKCIKCSGKINISFENLKSDDKLIKTKIIICKKCIENERCIKCKYIYVDNKDRSYNIKNYKYSNNIKSYYICKKCFKCFRCSLNCNNCCVKKCNICDIYKNVNDENLCHICYEHLEKFNYLKFLCKKCNENYIVLNRDELLEYNFNNKFCSDIKCSPYNYFIKYIWMNNMWKIDKIRKYYPNIDKHYWVKANEKITDDYICNCKKCLDKIKNINENKEDDKILVESKYLPELHKILNKEIILNDITDSSSSDDNTEHDEFSSEENSTEDDSII